MIATAEEFIRRLRNGAEAARLDVESVGRFLERLGEGNAWLMCLILTLPFIQPLPTGPIATLGGLAFAGIGIRLRRGEEALWLPGKLRALRPGPRTWNAFSGFGCWLLGTLSHVSRPGRLVGLVDRLGHRGAATLVLVGGLLVAVPFLVVPLQNSLPALIIFFTCLGRLQRDGAMYLLALLSLVVTLVYFALILWGLTFAAGRGWEWLGA